jgi:hypothetical protein
MEYHLPELARWRAAIIPLTFLTGLGIPLVCRGATLARQGSAPDSARISWVRVELRQFDDVRITTGGESILVQGPIVSIDGLRFSSATGRSGITSSTPPPQRLVPWAVIDSIHARKGASGSGVVIGAVAGLAVGLVIVAGNVIGHAKRSSRPTEDSVAPILLGAVGGAALGALIDRPGRWQYVYP